MAVSKSSPPENQPGKPAKTRPPDHRVPAARLLAVEAGTLKLQRDRSKPAGSPPAIAETSERMPALRLDSANVTRRLFSPPGTGFETLCSCRIAGFDFVAAPLPAMEAKVTLCRELEQIYPGKIFRRVAGVGTAGEYCAAIKDSPPAGPSAGKKSKDEGDNMPGGLVAA